MNLNDMDIYVLKCFTSEMVYSVEYVGLSQLEALKVKQRLLENRQTDDYEIEVWNNGLYYYSLGE